MLLSGSVASAASADAADAAHDPTVLCSAYTRANGVVAFSGIAQAPSGHAQPVSLRITCSYTGDYGTYYGTIEAPASVVTTHGSALIGMGDLTVCASAVATYADGHVGVAPERCDVVNPLPVPNNEIDHPAPIECQKVRPGSLTSSWVLVAAAVAPQRTVPVTSTRVRCTVEGGAGPDMMIENAMPGGIAVAAGVVLNSYPLETGAKCTNSQVTYLDGAVNTSVFCATNVPDPTDTLNLVDALYACEEAARSNLDTLIANPTGPVTCVAAAITQGE